MLTEFDFRPRSVTIFSGVEMTGYRLRPGTVLRRDAFDAIAENHDQAGAILDDACGEAGDLVEMIEALSAPGATTRGVAGAAGVSIRSVQRRFQEKGLPPPDFWRLLARVRRAVVMLAGPDPLAEIACTCGFSDQAHMTREITRWFGAGPIQLRGNPTALDLLAQPALGTWTGEQISTR